MPVLESPVYFDNIAFFSIVTSDLPYSSQWIIFSLREMLKHGAE